MKKVWKNLGIAGMVACAFLGIFIDVQWFYGAAICAFITSMNYES